MSKATLLVYGINVEVYFSDGIKEQNAWDGELAQFLVIIGDYIGRRNQYPGWNRGRRLCKGIFQFLGRK